MKKIFLLALLAKSMLFAQNVKLTWSPEIELKKKEFISDIIHADKTGIYYTKAKRAGMYAAAFGARPKFETVEKLSPSFSTIFSKEVTAFEDDDIAIRSIDFAKDGFLVFLSKYSRKEGGSKYFVSNMDMNANIKGTPKEYLSITEETFAKVANTFISPSYDSTKFLVLAEREQSRHNKKEEEKVILTVFNNSGTKEWQKTIKIDGKTDGAVNIIQQQIAPNGDIYFLLKEYTTEKIKETIKDANGNKTPGYKFRVLKVTDKGATVKNFAVDLGKSYINSADIKINTQNNNLICSGFYNDQDNEVLKGLFYFEIDNTGNVTRKNNKDFPQEFVEEFKKNKGTKKDKKNNDDDDLGLSKSFTVDKVYARADGGAYLLAEFYYTYTRCYTTSSGTRCNTYYIHNDILTVNISADGTIDWFHRIPKKQTEVNIHKYSSYISTMYKDNLYVLFNDNPKNQEIEEDEKSATTANYKKAVCMLQKIDKDKNVTKKELFKNEDLEKILCPFASRVLSENTIILFADRYRDNDAKLGKIVIE